MTQHNDHEWTDRRSREQMRVLVDEALRERVGLYSLKKNGHTLGQWLDKAVTPERVGILVLLAVQFIYMVGGRMHEYDEGMQTLAEQQRRTDVMQKQHQDINAQIADIVAMQKRDAQAQLETRELVDLTVKQNAAIQSRMQLQPTRQEVNSTTQQQLIPRLDRIERQLRMANP